MRTCGGWTASNGFSQLGLHSQVPLGTRYLILGEPASLSRGVPTVLYNGMGQVDSYPRIFIVTLFTSKKQDEKAL